MGGDKCWKVSSPSSPLVSLENVTMSLGFLLCSQVSYLVFHILRYTKDDRKRGVLQTRRVKQFGMKCRQQWQSLDAPGKAAECHTLKSQCHINWWKTCALPPEAYVSSQPPNQEPGSPRPEGQGEWENKELSSSTKAAPQGYLKEVHCIEPHLERHRNSSPAPLVTTNKLAPAPQKGFFVSYGAIPTFP